MKWHTFLMGAAATERMAKSHLSHAVDLDTLKPLCGLVKLSSLTFDMSLCKPGELPDCPICQRRVKNEAKATP